MAEYCTLEVDGAGRTYTLSGMSGPGSDLSREQVLRFLRRKPRPDVERSVLVYYEDENQLCCQDLEGFIKENSDAAEEA